MVPKQPHNRTAVQYTISVHCILQRLIHLLFAAEGVEGEPVKVDNMLTKWLRAHQREGVQFMFDCVTGQKPSGGHGWCEFTISSKHQPIFVMHAAKTLALHDKFHFV